MTSVVQQVTSGVFTSVTLIKDMVLKEREIVDRIQESTQRLVSNGYSQVTRFYHKRLATINSRNFSREIERLNHPNDYESANIESILPEVAGEQDMEGARESLIRLQEVYNLQPREMAKGNYLNYKGPELSASDVYLIGKTAFTIEKYLQAVQWLTIAVDLMSKDIAITDPYVETPSFGMISPGNTAFLTDAQTYLGRSLLRVGDQENARKLYTSLVTDDIENENIQTLGFELKSVGTVEIGQNQVITKFYNLCQQQSKTSEPTSMDSRLRCRFAYILLPYYRFHEEILSNTPYISMFYDVITSTDAERIKKDSSAIGLTRGKISPGLLNETTSSFRTSHVTFLSDEKSEAAAFLSRRISYLTHLDASKQAAEPHQVVNYGLGGHYALHLDVFLEERAEMKARFENYGNRMATFLIYLTDVERGGSTAFPGADLVVSPTKGNAVFWYSFTPDGEIDHLTEHAGCPVVIGEKWIINKWIWTYGNTFTRRCGLKPNASQLDIERDMYSGYRGKHKKQRTRK
ncbi:prolyl 4-hydroxylase subunit alpha-2 [Biomphalaria pfeifferi]|uniref:procollagen-proline 4-dioxygenase n=1 Tax=Biomphalaria pfeifferi TaxID=112525 RepID=A0AAD8F2D5_BIOPF|nr:prolyl 4-hydroxylase subunit alpha-2 [Biomphalaria pfeifferi]